MAQTKTGKCEHCRTEEVTYENLPDDISTDGIVLVCEICIDESLGREDERCGDEDQVSSYSKVKIR